MTNEALLIAVAVPVILSLIGLLGPVLLHIQSKRKLDLDRDTRALSAAQKAIQSALEERGLERRVEELFGLVRDLAKSITDLKDSLPERYVRRDDWIQAQSRTERKLDSIWGEVHAIARQMPPGGPTPAPTS